MIYGLPGPVLSASALMGLNQPGQLLRKRGREVPLIPDGEDTLPFADFPFFLLTQSHPLALTPVGTDGAKPLPELLK